jgi:hypothetical protein
MRMMHAPLIGPYLLGRHNVLAKRGVYLSVVGREIYAIVPALEPLDDVVVDQTSGRSLAGGSMAWGRRGPWRDCTRRANFIASPQSRDVIASIVGID